MRICDNGVYRDMTADEERNYKELILASDVSTEEDKLEKLEQEITATQEALCELYESVV
jgi:hypothetical protein